MKIIKILVDTNVILDFFLFREPKREAVTELFEQICQERIEAFTTASSITDIYYITAKRLGDSQAREVLYNLLGILGIISVDGADCAKALDLPISDFEDALVVTCAEKADVGYVISSDKDFLCVKTPATRVITAEDFLKMLRD